jgi:hypothetical protein
MESESVCIIDGYPLPKPVPVSALRLHCSAEPGRDAPTANFGIGGKDSKGKRENDV